MEEEGGGDLGGRRNGVGGGEGGKGKRGGKVGDCKQTIPAQVILSGLPGKEGRGRGSQRKRAEE